MLIEGTLLGLLILTVFVQLYSLNSALYYQEPVLVVPLFYSVYTILSFVNAIVYLSSIELTSTGDVFILMTGIGLLIAGVWTLRSGRLGH